jgi:hypothetical protein
MTALELAGRLQKLSTGAEVSVQQVETATKLVLDGGVSAERIELFTDRFSEAALEGRLPEATRQAYVDSLLRLVNALPEDGASLLAVRAQKPVAEELQHLEGVIKGYEREIAELDRQIAATDARITQKLGRIDELNARRADLLRQIETANRQKQGVLFLAAIVGVLTAGLGAPLAGVAAGGAMAAAGIASAQSTIDGVQRELSVVSQERSELGALRTAYETEKKAFETSLGTLRAEEKALREAVLERAAEAEAPEVRAAVRLLTSRSLANNLKEQVKVLRAQLGSARAFEQQLDGIIVRLEQEVAGLEKRAEQAQKELLETILVTVIALAGLNPRVRMTLSRVTQLTRGIDFLRMSVQQQVAKLLQNAVLQGLMSVTGSRFASQAILRALDIFGDGSLRADGRATDRALSGPQVYLLDLIARSRAGIDRAAEEQRVLAREQLSDDEARREAKRLVKSLEPAAALLPVGEELRGWREARVLLLRAEALYRGLAGASPEGFAEALGVVRGVVAEARGRLRPETPAHRALELFLGASEKASNAAEIEQYASPGLYSALAVLSLDRAGA